MYKILFIAATIVTCACANNDPNDVHAETLKNEVEVNHDGSYKYAYETSNGIAGQEAGVGGEFANGAHSYYSPEGELIQLQYKADENGYQPQGSHLPTPPPIPAYVIKSLEYIRTHPHPEEQHAASSFQPQQYRAPVQQHRQQQAQRQFGGRRHF